jgi:hypothetical protein
VIDRNTNPQRTMTFEDADQIARALEQDGPKLGRPGRDARKVPQPGPHLLAQAGSCKSSGESGTIITEAGRVDWEATAKVARVLIYKDTRRGAVLYAKIERFDTDSVEHSMDIIVEELGRRPETRRSVLSLQRGPDDGRV